MTPSMSGRDGDDHAPLALGPGVGRPTAPHMAPATSAPLGVAGSVGPAVAEATSWRAGGLLGHDGVLGREVVDDHVEDRRARAVDVLLRDVDVAAVGQL